MNELLEKAKKLGIEIPAITATEINDNVKPVLRKMEREGVLLDCDALKKLDTKLSVRVSEIEKDVYKLAGREFNLGSPSQLADLLFDEMKLPTEGLKKTKSGYSTAASELNKIIDASPIIPLILENRELSKLISTYLRPLPILVDENSRLHTTYAMETSTGRITSSEPNLQNIPIRGTYGEEMRAAFVASKGSKLIAADYSQIELRIVACLAKDQAMIEAFKNGEDIHTRTASEIFKVEKTKVTKDQRRKAKAVNFGIVYGQTPYGLSQALAIPVEEAGEYIRNYFDIHKGIKNYINDMITLAHSEGYVETLFGTKRYLPNINSHMRFIAESEERMAINMPVQGTAAELLKLAMIELDKKLSEKHGSRAKMLLTVHDELVLEAPESEAASIASLIKETMEGVIKLPVPIEVSIGVGNNWSEAK
jgi:DNA polymerase-1